MKPIRFGTDGWRGIIADDFTFTRVAAVCLAIGDCLREDGSAARGIAVGYDNRFAADSCAALAAMLFSQQGIAVRLSSNAVPTPVISHAIVREGLGGGIMITASHNPAAYNGVKFKPWFGGSASLEATQTIEARANAHLATLDLDELRARGGTDALLTHVDFLPVYLEQVTAMVEQNAIHAAKPRLYFDALHGSAAGVLDRALHMVGCEIATLHTEWNPGFGRLSPEPIAENLTDLIALVRDRDLDGALASDGDGDRLGAVTEEGEYVTPHQIFALLLMHLVEDKGRRGGVVKTVSTSTMIDTLAARYKLPLYETPIGFKYIGALMREEDILIGGEESGGIGFAGHIPERDATLAALFLVEMMAMRHTTLAGLLAQLRSRVGDHAYHRRDVRLTRPIGAEQMAILRQALPARIGGVNVREVSEKDGIKLLLEDGAWLLLRPSGTEPVLRIYAEAETRHKVDALLNAGAALVNGQLRLAA